MNKDTNNVDHLVQGIPFEGLLAAETGLTAASALIGHAADTLREGDTAIPVEPLITAQDTCAMAAGFMAVARQELHTFVEDITGANGPQSSPEPSPQSSLPPSPHPEESPRQADATGAEAPTANVVSPAVSPEQPPLTLYPDTALDTPAFVAAWRGWMQGETAESRSVDIAELPITPEQWATLAADAKEYRQIDLDPWLPKGTTLDDHLRERYMIDRAQFEIIKKTYAAFREAVRQDGIRAGLGINSEPDDMESTIMMGTYDHTSETDNFGWHTDYHTKPTLRYVLSYGEGLGTVFAHGTPERSKQRAVSEGASAQALLTGTWERVQPAQGKVTRFPSRFGFHSPPQRSGFRLFMTVSLFLEGEG